MCGISGTLGLSDPTTVALMNRALAHRGPDDAGVFCDSSALVALGHRRLSILDLSSDGHQPMSYANGRFHIVYNGEIYNFRQLRGELTSLGHTFRSDSDTEVLLAAYSQWGSQCLLKLRGMFAFAVFDRVAAERGDASLFLARDRLGVKPLYYAQIRDCFVFSSEIKGMLASGLVSRQSDHQAILHYLSLGSVPQPRTILSDVKMLLPGHWLQVGLHREIETGCYWEIGAAARASFPDAGKLNSSEAGVHLRSLLDDATRLHLVSDVPVGAFLSGGIDSTAVVGLMSQASSEPIQTFSLSFEGAEGNFDELPWAELVSKRFGTIHTHQVVSDQDVTQQFERMLFAIDQPSLDGANSFLVSKLASGSVKVALSGLGGDELFAGYPHFRTLALAEKRELSWGVAGGEWARCLMNLLPKRLTRNHPLSLLSRSQRLETLRNLLGQSGAQIVNSGFAAMAIVEPLGKVYEPLLKPDLDATSELTSVEVGAYLVNTLLRDVDAMSMAHSLEVRPLLLDHVVAEFAFGMSSQIKYSPTENKPALVNSLRDILPPEVIGRKKMGFELPLARWLYGGLQDRAVAAFSSERAKKIFHPEYLKSTVLRLLNSEPQALATWGYFVLLEWLETNEIDV